VKRIITVILKIFLSLVPISFFLLLVGCGSGSSPGKTAVEMFEKVCKENDYNVFLEYIAPESATIMGVGIGMMKQQGAAKSADYCKSEIKIVSEKVTENTAVVILNFSKDPINMRKIDGKWKVYIKK
jgi:hypothetical protein